MTISALIGAMLSTVPARAHGTHGEEPFAATFETLRKMKFMVREGHPDAQTAFIKLPDGTEIALDDRLQTAAREMAGRFYDDEPSSPTPQRWRDHAKAYASTVVQKLDYFFSRKFVLELSGVGVEAYYRFGVIATVVIVAVEMIDHSPANIFAVPLCPIIYGTWEFCSKETQEMSRVLSKPFPVRTGLMDRIRMWSESKVWRSRIWQGTKHVFTAESDTNLNDLAKWRMRHDAEPGFDTLAGGLIKPGFYRNSIARPIFPADAHAHDHDHDQPHEHAELVDPGADAVVEFKAFDTTLSPGERIVRAEEYIDYIEVILRQTQLAAGDLLRLRDPASGQMVRVPLKQTFKRAPGYLGLRRDLARMRRAVDLYGHALRLRALNEGARTAVEAQIDRTFAGSLGTFLQDFSARLREVDALAAPRVNPWEQPVYKQPKRMMEILREWVTHGESCAEALLRTT